ncbi:unnamed protein product [Rotaria sp. Silwood1]|nr:unnamed protein product [Rotaria sp. Silwood1]
MLDIGYFIRALDIRLRYRFSQQKKKNLWIESVTHNYCGLSDMDMNWHMNNARYLREADFSRFALLGETGLWDAIKIRRKKEPQTSLLVSAIQIQYLQSVSRGDRFTFIARLVGWDERAFYISQTMILDKKCELPIQQQMDVVKQARSIVLTHETFTGLFAPNIATVAVTANKNNSQGLVPTSCSTTQTNGINTASEQHGNNHLIVIGNMLFTTTT